MDSGSFDDSFRSEQSKNLANHLREDHTKFDETNICNAIITMNEVENAVKTAKANKAVGCDGIKNELLKHENVVNLLTNLFTLCYKHCMIPDAWRKTIISPIPKEKGKIIDPLKYHGIALQNCICKVLSNVINTRVVKILDESKVLDDVQNRFHKNRSCLHHVFNLTTLVNNKCLDQSSEIFAGFTDFRKAFNVINRDLLYCALRESGIHGRMLSLVKEMYTGTNNIIRLNDEFTDEFVSTNGVLQGNNLSPTMFSIYINSLLLELRKNEIGVCIDTSNKELVNVLAYADDIVLVAENEQDLQKLLKLVEDWCTKWRISVNKTKTKIIHFQPKGKNSTECKFYIDNSELEVVEQYKYLGTWMHCHLDTEYNVNMLAQAGSHVLSQLIGKTRLNCELGYKTYSTLFNSLVCPILDYGSGAWCTGHNCKKLDQVQQWAIRYFCGIPRSSPLSGLEGDMGWLPSVVRRDLENVRLYNQLIKMHQGCLMHKLFMYDRKCEGRWSVNMRNICENSEMLTNWNAMEFIPVKKFVKFYWNHTKRCGTLT